MRLRDVSLLALLVASAKQKDDLIPLLTKIDTIALPLMNAQFTHAMTYWLDVAEMPKLKTLQPSGDLLPGTLVTQAAQPCSEDVCLPNYVQFM